VSDAHHPLGASGASRWLACPGSVRLSADLPDPGSAYAEEGTLAHQLAEVCLSQHVDPEDVPGDYSSDMRYYTRVYLDYCWGL